MTGSRAAAICGDWNDYHDGYGYWWQEAPAAAGGNYSLSAWFFSDYGWNPAEQGLVLAFYNDPPVASNLLGSATNVFFDVAESWAQKSVAATAPPGTRWVRATIYAQGVGTSGSLQFDDVDMREQVEHPGPSSRRSPLIISEIMYNPAARADGRNAEFIELYNTEGVAWDLGGWRLEGETKYTFPPGTVIEPYGYRVVAADPVLVAAEAGLANVLGPCTGKLSNSEGLVQLVNNHGACLLELEYADQWPWPYAADGAGPSLVLAEPSYGEADPRAWRASTYVGGSPGRADPVYEDAYTALRINEFLAHTDYPLGDYVELYNAGAGALDLAGCLLSDNRNTNGCVIPAGTMVAAGGFVSFDTNALGFNLSSYGEELVLKSPDGRRVLDMVVYGGQQNAVASGRYPDGGDGFFALRSRSPGGTNAPALLRDIVINEIMYNPLSRDGADEYIELHNRGVVATNIGGWRVSGGVQFLIPADTIIPAGGYLVLAANATNLIAKYPALSTANTLGDFSGALANGGERLALEALDDPADTNGWAWVLMDEAYYRDGAGTENWSDAGGSSLELMDPRADNCRPEAWLESDESKKSAWVSCAVTGALAYGMLYSGTEVNQVNLMLLGGGECLVDEVEVVPQGGGNLVINGGFESGSSGWTMQGNHVASQVINSNAYAGSRALMLCGSGGGDTGANRVFSSLSARVETWATASLRFKARWLRGLPYVLLRLRGNYLEASCELPVPANLGTPGEINSRYRATAGPVISSVRHDPPLPAAGGMVSVSAQIQDPDGISWARVYYRVDPAPGYSMVAMTNNRQGVFSACLPAQSAGTLVAFKILACDAAIPSATNQFPLPSPVRECLVRYGEVSGNSGLGQYIYWMSQTNMDRWTSRENLSNEPLDTTLVCGQRIIYNAGIRYRGSPFVRQNYGNAASTWASYLTVLPPGNRFLGSDELNQDWLEPDRESTFVRERTSFRLAEQIGLSASYQRYVRLYLNGVARAYVHTDSQQVDGDYVSTWFPDEAGGDFYKIDDWFEYGNSMTEFVNQDGDLGNFSVSGQKCRPRYRWNWEKRGAGGYTDNYSNLFHLADAANYSGTNLSTALETLADVRQWMAVFALRHAVADWDGYGYQRGKNMFAYRPPEGKWRMLLWDLDWGLGATSWMNPWSDLFEVADTLPVIKQVMQHPPFKRYYWQALMQLAYGPMTATNINPYMTALYSMLSSAGLSPADPGAVQTWTADRRSYMLSVLAPVMNVPLAITSNGGGDFTITSNLLALCGNAPIQADTLRINGVAYPLQWLSETTWLARVALTTGVNQLSVQAYAANGLAVPGLLDSIRVTYNGPTEQMAGRVVINEIMYAPAVSGASFIELFNTSTNTAFDLYNCRLCGVDLTFSNSLVLAPRQYAVVASSAALFAHTYGLTIAVAAAWPGALDNQGEALQLARLDSTGGVQETISEVGYAAAPPWPAAAAQGGISLQLMDAAQPASRVANWAADPLIRCTPGAANSVAHTLPQLRALWLNEIQPTNAHTRTDNFGRYEPWVEVFNNDTGTIAMADWYLTDDFAAPCKWAFPVAGTLASGAFQLVWADAEPEQTAETNWHASFRLNAATGVVALVYSNAGHTLLVDTLPYTSVPADRSLGCWPDGVWTNRTRFHFATPGAPNNHAGAPYQVFINEWLADNETGLVDPATGTPQDWFELYNAGTTAVNLAGFTLTDNLSSPGKWAISNGVVLQAGEFRLVWADEKPAWNLGATNDLHANFKLSKEGEALGLYTPERILVDAVQFGAQETDVSEGRWPDGAADAFYTLGQPTPRAPNIWQTNQLFIAVACGAHGRVAPSGVVAVAWGHSQAFQLEPDGYYHISRVETNGLVVAGVAGAATNWTWMQVQSNGTLGVFFAENLATNGVPEWWLAQHGLTNAAWDVEALADQDGDFFAAWQEWQAGTDPTNAGSFFHLQQMAQDPDGLGAATLSWPSSAGRYYALFVSTNPVADAFSQSLGVYLPATPPLNTYTDAAPDTAAPRLYRIAVE